MGTRGSAVASATRSRRWRIILVSICGLLAAALAAAPTQATFGPAVQWGSTGSGNGQFNTARGVATDSTGNVYVVDWTNARVQKFTSTGTFITKWGSPGSANGQFNAPLGIATDSAGNVYVADSANQRIQKFNASGGFLTKWGSLGTANGKFHGPYGVATDSTGNVYVVDQENSRIQKFNSNGGFITKWGTAGSGNGQFNNPVGIATDSAGNVYVVDRDNNRIQKFTSSGAFITKWGSAGSGAGQFAAARGIAIDQAGEVYVSDVGNNRVQKFSSTGTFRGAWGWGVRDGSSAFQLCGVACQQGIAGSGVGQFSSLGVGVAIRGGKIYAVDANRVQVFEGAPEVTIESAPDETTSDTAASLTFASDEDGAFECSLDGGGWEPCSSPYATGELSDGGHSFAVRATNLLGIPSEEASHEWVVDTAAPEPGVSGALADSPGGWVNQGDYEVTGSAQDSGSGVTELELLVDDEPVDAVSQPCGSGGCSFDHTFTVDTSEYGGGAHTAELVATDDAGNAESEAWDFNVNPAGTIDSSEAADTLAVALPDLIESSSEPGEGTIGTDFTDGFSIPTPDGSATFTPSTVGSAIAAGHAIGDHLVVHANSSVGSDTALVSVTGGVSLATQIRSASAPVIYEWDVDLPSGQILSGAAQIEGADAESAEIKDNAGDVVATMDLVGVRDGADQAVSADLSITQETVRLTLEGDPSDVTYPLVLEANARATSPEDDDSGDMVMGDEDAGSVTVPNEGTGSVLVEGPEGDVTMDIPATGPAIESEGNTRVFTGSAPDTEVSVTDLGGLAQAQVLIGDPASPEIYDFPFGEDVATLVPWDEGGGLTILDNGGQMLGTVGAPWAMDANGSEVPTHYEVDGLTVTQVVDHEGGGYAYPIVADPPVITLTHAGWRFGHNLSRRIARAALNTISVGVGALVCSKVKAVPGVAAACGALVAAVIHISGGELRKKVIRGHKCLEVGVNFSIFGSPVYAKVTDC